MAQIKGGAPFLVTWSERWKAPTFVVTCPHCGVRSIRRASSWSNNLNTGLRAMVLCENGGVFETLIPVDDEELRRYTKAASPIPKEKILDHDRVVYLLWETYGFVPKGIIDALEACARQ